MKNAIKLFVIIAFAAIIGFAFTACPGEPDEPDDEEGTLEGTVSITANEFGNYTTLVLTAKYTGTESVTYAWQRSGSVVSGGTDGKLTPLDAGDYTVFVSASGYSNHPESEPVTIAAAPDYVGFLGKWVAPKNAAGATQDETLTIKATNFHFYWASTDDPDNYFEIKSINATSGWAKQASRPNWVKDDFVSSANFSTQVVCYKLTGTVDNTGKYLDADAVTGYTNNGLYLFLKGGKLYRSYPDMTNIVDGDAGRSEKYRPYTKQ
jgi:hypothetical protein